MKRLLLTGIISLLFLSSWCQTPPALEKGVSQELAKHRFKYIRFIRYNLDFEIPEDKAAPVKGYADINFFLVQGGDSSDLQIDFCGNLAADSVNNVIAFIHNSILSGYFPVKYENQHIIIPKKFLFEGENTIRLDFECSDKPLNRRDDYMYTLFVPANARYAFPCFDQPDLKASFRLSLTVPRGWTALSTGKIIRQKSHKGKDGKEKTVFVFDKADNIPTYLFSFTAGVFQERKEKHKGFEIRGLYRQQDTSKTNQLSLVFQQMFNSVDWMIKYTGVPFPFQKLDFVVLPGYQFGGMEHIGAIQFNDRRIFLSPNPSLDEQLSRAELISHEVSHMWFGDMVTMKWFNDVWTKEVFANYMASLMMQEQFPQYGHTLDFIRRYNIPALEEDRTHGTHPIAQNLENLQDAGLLYGNIIYKKAPVVMKKLHQKMGDVLFRKGLSKYLKKYAYTNATWGGLVEIMSDLCPEEELEEFSLDWVSRKGVPVISYKLDPEGTMDIKIEEEKDIVWPQSVTFALFRNGVEDLSEVKVDISSKSTHLKVPSASVHVIPNFSGEGYGRFICTEEDLAFQIKHWYAFPKEETRLSVLMNLYENVLMHRISADKVIDAIIPQSSESTGLYAERNLIIASAALNYVSTLSDLSKNSHVQERLWQLSQNHPEEQVRQKALRILISKATDTQVVEKLYDIWKNQSSQLLNQSDYIDLSYQLAVRYPDKWNGIISTQLARIDNEDKKKEFEFVSRACTPDLRKQIDLFNELLEPENRKIEPWALKVISLLNHPLREPVSNRFIRPALDELPEVQQTGDIFFPKNWCQAILDGHKSPEARQILLDYLTSKAPVPQPLLNKLLMAGYFLLNAED